MYLWFSCLLLDCVLLSVWRSLFCGRCLLFVVCLFVRWLCQMLVCVLVCSLFAARCSLPVVVCLMFGCVFVICSLVGVCVFVRCLVFVHVFECSFVCLLFVGCLFVVCCSLFMASRSLFVDCCLLFAVLMCVVC